MRKKKQKKRYPEALLLFLTFAHIMLTSILPFSLRADEEKKLEISEVKRAGRKAEFLNTHFLFPSLELKCKNTVFRETEKRYRIIISEGKSIYDEFFVDVYGVEISASGIHGRIFDRKITSESFSASRGYISAGWLCISLCGLECPHSGILLERFSFDERKERIYLRSPSLLLFGRKIPFFLSPRKLDTYGKAPGFLPPELSLSEKHGIIGGAGVFIPFSFFGLPPLDLSFYTRFFSKTKIFLGEVGGSYNFRNFKVNLNGFLAQKTDVFSISSDIYAGSENIGFSLSSLLVSRSFLELIPARVEFASVPFSYAYSEASAQISKSVKTSYYTRFYSDFLTRSGSLTSISLSGNIKLKELMFEFSPTFFLLTENIRDERARFFPFPSAQIDLMYSGFELSARHIFFSENLVRFLSDMNYISSPYRFWGGRKFFRRLKDDFVLSPSYLYISWEDFWLLPSFFLPFSFSPRVVFSPYIALSMFRWGGERTSKGAEEPVFIFAPELGGDIILHPFLFYMSFGTIYPTQENSPSHFFSGFGATTTFGEGMVLDLSFSSISRFFLFSSYWVISQNLGFSDVSLHTGFHLSNSFSVFSMYGEKFLFTSPGITEGFSSLGLSFDFSRSFLSNTKLSFSSFLYYSGSGVKPVQLTSTLSQRIKEICGEVFISLIYNFTGRGEPRLGFGAKLNI